MAENIVHIDLNAFFAQCEENADPLLKGKPVAVGGDHRRGIISTANYIARKFGVHSAMPVFQAKRLCPQLIIVPGHYGLYSSVSHRFMAFLGETYKQMEPVSIDETYLNVNAFCDDSHAYDYLRDLQMKIYINLGLKCSIGYGHTKFMAKMASDFQKPMGLTLIKTDEYKTLFWPLPIDKMWGVGKKTAPKLEKLGIKTIGDLANNDDKAVKDELGSMFNVFHEWANGRGDDFVDSSFYQRKSISSSSTFLEDTDDVSELKEMLKALCREVAEELAASGKKTHSIVVSIRNADFSTHSKRGKLSEDTNDFQTIYLGVLAVFTDFYKGQKVRLLGVGVEDMENNKEAFQQLQLFTSKNSTPDKTIPNQHFLSSSQTPRQLVDKLNKGLDKDLFTTLGDMKKGEKK